MQNLNAEYFFDLHSFKHSKLFLKSAHPWNAVTQIAEYLNTFSLGNIEVNIPSGAFIVDSHLVSIGKGTVVEPGAYIRGPCIIGENCSIRHGAYIRGHVITGDRCVIGHDTEVKNSILLDEAHAAHFAYLGDTILGNKVNLGAGTKCANFKLDAAPVSVWKGEEKIDTGLRKLGAIIGDGSQIGCNSVTNPGALLGKGVVCYPCLNIGGFVPSCSIVKSTTRLEISSYIREGKF